MTKTKPYKMMSCHMSRQPGIEVEFLDKLYHALGNSGFRVWTPLILKMPKQEIHEDNKLTRAWAEQELGWHLEVVRRPPNQIIRIWQPDDPEPVRESPARARSATKP